MRSVLRVFAGLFILIMPATVRAQNGSDQARPSPAQEKQIREVYQRLLRSDANRDTAALKQILAPSYTFVPARGDTILTREQRLSGQPADTTRTERSYTLHNCRTQVYGTTALAHCRYTAKIKYPSTGADSTREFISTAVFVQQGKNWQIVASHPSLVRPR
jgi:ketosteroid isomerase-like protein